MFNQGFHPFHLVSLSPWPLIASINAMCLAMNLFYYLLNGDLLPFIISVLSTSLMFVLWMRDIIRESTFSGSHSAEVCEGLYSGVVYFIISEVMFFFSFFFSYFFLSLVPSVDLVHWPPFGVQTMSFMEVPLLNTLILLSSGLSITWMHYSIICSDSSESSKAGIVTVALGVVFLYFQYKEYFDSFFSMSDSVYGSFFFLMTGFHGMHVFIGMIFIFVSLVRLVLGHFSSLHHLGFEASAWYWHFVDVVWLFLFVSVYWWGS